jgi:hypothetical protein
LLFTPVVLLEDHNRCVKRRLALLETNPPRNSQPETHLDRRPGDGFGRLVRRELDKLAGAQLSDPAKEVLE